MKIDEAKSTATLVGDIQTNAVSIDINNIGFITQLLSTNLYSKPIDSFLREIVSNAWDSHVEAGNNEPIILEIGTDTEGRHFCRIQDFGVGLSPQRFNDIYRNIGSSTKRSDNTQIGGFGIGRFSALAYSGTVYLTSNHDGTKYKYLMYKDGNHIKIDELFNLPTEERDGLEVMVYVKDADVVEFRRAMKNQLVYFENLYINFDRYQPSKNSYDYRYDSTFADAFNGLKIKRYNHFSVNTFGTNDTTTLCLGKIQYPLNPHSLMNTKFRFDENYPISVNFEIGDLEVTPNREQILYTRDNIKKIEDKLDLVQEEIEEIINKYETKDYDVLGDYIEQLKNPTIYIPILEDDSTFGNNVYLKVKRKSNKITYKGKTVSQNAVEMYNFLMNVKIPHQYISFRAYMGRIETKNPGWYTYNFDTLLTTAYDCIVDTDPEHILTGTGVRKIFTTEYSNLNNITKDYIRSHANSGSFFLKHFTNRSIIKGLITILKGEVSRRYAYTKFNWNKNDFRLILSDLLPILKHIPHITNKSVPQSYIDKRQAELKAARDSNKVAGMNWNEEVNLFVLRKSDRVVYGKRDVTTDSERITLDNLRIKWKKFPVIYSVKDDPFLRDLYWVFSTVPNSEYTKYRFVEIAPSKINILKDFPNFIRIEKFMSVEYKKIRQLATARYLLSEYPFIEDLHRIGDTLSLISNKLYNVVTEINTYIVSNSIRSYNYDPAILEDIDKICKDNNYYDEEMLGFVKENLKMLEGSKFLTLITDGRGKLQEKSINFAVGCILSKKLFRPDLEAVSKLRKQTIFNKKEENENN